MNRPGSSHILYSSQGLVRIGLVVVLAATYFSYAVTTRFTFAYDDFPQIIDNPRVHSAAYLPQYFTKQVWAHAGQPENLYRPLFLAWLLANFSAFADYSTGWHLTTVLMHLVVSLLVYLLARRLLPDKKAAALVAAAVFALHPSRVEAVAWVSGVTEPLSAAFFLGGFLCYIHYRERQYCQPAWLAASLGLYIAALLTKETAIVLPALLACYELIKRQRFQDAYDVSRQALKLEPNLPATLSAAAQTAYLLDDYTAAEQFYLKALELAPPRVDQLYYLGLARTKLGRYREALKVLQRGDSLWPNSPGYHIAMGRAWAGIGDWATAREQYKLELEFYPKNPWARAALADAESHMPPFRKIPAAGSSELARPHASK